MRWWYAKHFDPVTQLFGLIRTWHTFSCEYANLCSRWTACWVPYTMPINIRACACSRAYVSRTQYSERCIYLSRLDRSGSGAGAMVLDSQPHLFKVTQTLMKITNNIYEVACQGTAQFMPSADILNFGTPKRYSERPNPLKSAYQTNESSSNMHDSPTSRPPPNTQNSLLLDSSKWYRSSYMLEPPT